VKIKETKHYIQIFFWSWV